MGKKLQGLPLAVVLSAIVLAILVSACGSSSSDPSTSSTDPTAGNGNSASLGGPAGPASFIEAKNPNSKYAKFGKEATSAELTAASEVLAENLEAREAADFATQCATMSVAANEETAEVKNNASEARAKCAGALKKLATPLKNTKPFRVNNFGGLLAAFRVKGNTGYALYHGVDKIDCVMPMVKEGSVWKVGSITTTEVP